MNILCDIDGVLHDFVTPMLAWVRKHCGTLYSYEDITEYPGFNCLATGDRNLLLKRTPGDRQFCFGMCNTTEARIPGAQRFLKDLLKMGHKVHLVTSPWPGEHWRKAREEFIESMLSFSGGSKITWEFIGDERVNMAGDILVEDVLQTAKLWGLTGRRAILIDRPWNRCEEDPHKVLRAKDIDTAGTMIDILELTKPEPRVKGPFRK